jgi:hypothetical protein
MIDWGEGLIVSVCILITYVGIKVINRLFERTDTKKKNSLF